MNENKKLYDVNYIRNNCKWIKLLLNKKKDADIIEYLADKTNVNGYLKTLIRNDMMKEKEN